MAALTVHTSRASGAIRLHDTILQPSVRQAPATRHALVNGEPEGVGAPVHGIGPCRAGCPSCGRLRERSSTPSTANHCNDRCTHRAEHFGLSDFSSDVGCFQYRDHPIVCACRNYGLDNICHQYVVRHQHVEFGTGELDHLPTSTPDHR